MKMQENKATIGKRIVNLRERKHMTQVKLAELSNVGHRTICDYEKGNSTPDAIALLNIAKALDVTTDYLLGVSPVENPEYIQISPTEFDYALYDTIKDLTPDEKRIILAVARGISDSKRKF